MLIKPDQAYLRSCPTRSDIPAECGVRFHLLHPNNKNQTRQPGTGPSPKTWTPYWVDYRWLEVKSPLRTPATPWWFACRAASRETTGQICSDSFPGAFNKNVPIGSDVNFPTANVTAWRARFRFRKADADSAGQVYARSTPSWCRTVCNIFRKGIGWRWDGGRGGQQWALWQMPGANAKKEEL